MLRTPCHVRLQGFLDSIGRVLRRVGGALGQVQTRDGQLIDAVDPGGGEVGLDVPAQAVEFSSGDWSGTIDTTLSYGASMRVQERDPELIGLANINPLVAATPITDQINAPGRFSVNSDDGNLNYDKNDLFSNAFKITSELSINYKENWGAFARASYFYDWENADRADLTEEAKEKVGTRLTLGFGLILALLVVVALLGIMGIQQA